MILTKELLQKYFGIDTSMGETCDCKECTILQQILYNQVKAVRYDLLADRYLNWDEKHLGELCGLYFDDNPLESD